MTNLERIRSEISNDAIFRLIDEEKLEWKNGHGLCTQCAIDNNNECPYPDYCIFSKCEGLVMDALESESEGFNFKDFLVSKGFLGED